ncbi:hypothetical protein ABZ153_09720 [Streptomyces sp. NPDC006290]|uniref:hypothetical protein n=1 Tax=Streptomyces sp. NPDC006290 TaxID=3156745 RepID=UPI0033A42BE9
MVEVVVVEAADGVHEVADGFGGGEGVEGEAAGGWCAGDVLCGGSGEERDGQQAGAGGDPGKVKAGGGDG